MKVMPLLLLSLFACGSAAPNTLHSPALIDPPPESTVDVGPPPVPTVLVSIEVPAVAHMQAVRIDPPETTTPFDCRAYVNGLDYGYHRMDVAMEAFRMTALCEGVSQASIDRFFPFAFNLIVKESGGCPNTRGNDRFPEGSCIQYHFGRAEDVGFGQATYSLYGPTGILCTGFGICQSTQILANPYDSMRFSVIEPLRLLGRYPWCDYTGAGGWHDCSLITKADRLI